MRSVSNRAKIATLLTRRMLVKLSIRMINHLDFMIQGIWILSAIHQESAISMEKRESSNIEEYPLKK